MKKCLGFLLILFVLSCKTTGRLDYNNIGLLNGKWESACTATFDAPDELECPMLIDFEYIEVNQQTGMGKTVFDDGYGKVETPFKIFKEGKKLMILYYDMPEEEDLKGEIITLNDKEFKVKFDQEKLYTIQKKAK